MNGAASNIDEGDDDLIAEIAPAVVPILLNCKFFEELDDRMCPTDETTQRLVCKNGFEISKAILAAISFPEEDITDIVHVLGYLGACCDCEVLYNVAGDNRLKAKYWRAQVH